MTEDFNFNHTKEFDKLFSKCDISVQKQLLKKLPDVGHDPNLGKPLKGKLQPFWSVHIGDYRLIYLVNNHYHEVTFVAVGHRKNIYGKIGRAL